MLLESTGELLRRLQDREIIRLCTAIVVPISVTFTKVEQQTSHHQCGTFQISTLLVIIHPCLATQMKSQAAQTATAGSLLVQMTFPSIFLVTTPFLGILRIQTLLLLPPLLPRLLLNTQQTIHPFPIQRGTRLLFLMIMLIQL